MQFLVYYASHFSGRGVPGILIWISCCFLKLTAVENWMFFWFFFGTRCFVLKSSSWTCWQKQSIECVHQFDQVAKLLVCAEGAFHLDSDIGIMFRRQQPTDLFSLYQMFLNSLSIKRLLSETSMRRQNIQVIWTLICWRRLNAQVSPTCTFLLIPKGLFVRLPNRKAREFKAHW